MKNTKTSISKDKIVQLVKKAFGENTIINQIKELKEGFFNATYMLNIRDNQKIVLKVSPPIDANVMRYEKSIMETEVFVLGRLNSDTDVPIPRVLFYDRDRDIIENEYFFMDFLQGTTLDSIYDELNEKQRTSISSELGKYAEQITGIKSDYFGDISKKDKQFTTWSEAFLFMIEELLLDARDNKVRLPYDYNEIYQLIEKHSNVLDMVEKASLVHKDMWKGNIFVDSQTAEIRGVVDYERAIYGDLLLEPVCGFLLQNAAFMNSFMGRTYLEKDEKIRSIIYRIYLFIIMIIECSFRKYPWENSDKWAREQLCEAMEDLLSYES